MPPKKRQALSTHYLRKKLRESRSKSKALSQEQEEVPVAREVPSHCVRTYEEPATTTEGDVETPELDILAAAAVAALDDSGILRNLDNSSSSEDDIPDSKEPLPAMKPSARKHRS